MTSIRGQGSFGQDPEYQQQFSSDGLLLGFTNLEVCHILDIILYDLHASYYTQIWVHAQASSVHHYLDCGHEYLGCFIARILDRTEPWLLHCLKSHSRPSAKGYRPKLNTEDKDPEKLAAPLTTGAGRGALPAIFRNRG